MSLYFLGFVGALFLAAVVIIWIAYCMFIRERHKSEFFHHNITDLQRKNYILDETIDEVPTKKEMAFGVFVPPSQDKQKQEEVEPKSDQKSQTPAHITNTDKLIDILDDTADKQ